jgi:aconitate hydratase
MGQAPATDKNSLRTVPRNFPGRSGTKEDKVFLCSPETAIASAIKGVITDPRTQGFDYPVVNIPEQRITNPENIESPLTTEEAKKIKLVKGPNIVSLPDFKALPKKFSLLVLLKVGDDISTDEISPAGAKVLPFRSNIPTISEFTFTPIDEEYTSPTKEHKSGHIIIAGENYGQGSSREHAALAPRYLGLRAVVAKSFARIHWQNLLNFGVLPLEFVSPEDYEKIDMLDEVIISDLPDALDEDEFTITINDHKIKVRHSLSPRQKEVVTLGGLINWIKENPAS